jgi:hypothetical protein
VNCFVIVRSAGERRDASSPNTCGITSFYSLVRKQREKATGGGIRQGLDGPVRATNERINSARAASQLLSARYGESADKGDYEIIPPCGGPRV